MSEYITIIIIAIALSMDAFSLSISIGTMNISKKTMLTTSLFVGIFHYIMPMFGIFFGKFILSVLNINSSYLIIICLIIIIILMFKELFENNEKEINFSFLSIIFFCFSVSIDSFTIGIGLNSITNNNFIAPLIFSIVSFSFTIIGLNMGKIAKKYLGKASILLSIFFLIFLVIVYLCK